MNVSSGLRFAGGVLLVSLVFTSTALAGKRGKVSSGGSLSNICSTDKVLDSPAQIQLAQKVSESQLKFDVLAFTRDMVKFDRTTYFSSGYAQILVEDLSHPLTQAEKEVWATRYQPWLDYEPVRPQGSFCSHETIPRTPSVTFDLIPPGRYRISVVSFDYCKNFTKEVIVPEIVMGSGQNRDETTPPELLFSSAMCPAGGNCILEMKVLDRDTGLSLKAVSDTGAGLDDSIRFFVDGVERPRNQCFVPDFSASINKITDASGMLPMHLQFTRPTMDGVHQLTLIVKDALGNASTFSRQFLLEGEKFTLM